MAFPIQTSNVRTVHVILAGRPTKSSYLNSTKPLGWRKYTLTKLLAAITLHWLQLIFRSLFIVCQQTAHGMLFVWFCLNRSKRSKCTGHDNAVVSRIQHYLYSMKKTCVNLLAWTLNIYGLNLNWELNLDRERCQAILRVHNACKLTCYRWLR